MPSTSTAGNFLYIVSAIAMTALCWGVYGPVLHTGQSMMSGGRMRPFICVGIAYFIIAIVIPVILISFGGWETDEKFSFNTRGLIWSLLGGTAGALGALGIVLALSFGGSPAYVMPIVFGLAPVFNTLYTTWMTNTWHKISPFYAAGIVLAAAGAATVLFTAPKPDKPHGAGDKKEARAAEVNPLVPGDAHAAERAEYEREKEAESSST
jgi:uncharacterized membrane protein